MKVLKQKKNIGILFPDSKKGGVFQYALSIIDGLSSFVPEFNYFVLHYDKENPKESLKNPENIQFVCLDSKGNNIFGKLKFLINVLSGRPFFSTNIKNKKILENVNLDLLICSLPSLLAFENKIPCMVSMLDIAHRYHPEFPEYNFKTRLNRDIIFKFSTRYSVLSIVDSQEGLDDLHKFYKIPKEKIRIIPYIPPGYVYKYKDMDLETAESLLKKYNLPEQFLFYPAQFWYHKNHQRLVKSLNLIKEKYGFKIPLVLTGSPDANFKNYQKTMSLIKEFNMQDQISNLGYVSDKEIVALYKKSSALVFPILIRPTNIPPLEAIVLGKPVLCSNFSENQKQIGGAGIFFDPFSEKDMAEKIYKFWKDKELKNELAKQSQEKAKEITLEKYAQKWQSAISEALIKS